MVRVFFLFFSFSSSLLSCAGIPVLPFSLTRKLLASDVCLSAFPRTSLCPFLSSFCLMQVLKETAEATDSLRLALVIARELLPQVKVEPKQVGRRWADGC